MPAELIGSRRIDLSQQAAELRVEFEERANQIPVITGYSALTYHGNAMQTWQAIIEGRSSAQRLDTEITVLQKGEPVNVTVPRLGTGVDFHPEDHFDRKEIRGIPPATAMAMYLAREAGWHAGILDKNGKLKPEFNSDRVGTSVASGGERMTNLIDIYTDLHQTGRQIRPLNGIGIFPGMQAHRIASTVGASGWSLSSTEACSTSLSSFADAAELIKNGINNIMLVGGTENVLMDHPELAIEIFGSMGQGVLSKQVDNPTTAVKPFDRERDGFYIADGGAVFVVESLASAEARGAEIHGIILNARKGMDPKDPVLSDPERFARLILQTLKVPGEETSSYPVDLIVAHGTATFEGDPKELEAYLMAIPYGILRDIPITDPKGSVGHLLGGAGGISMLCAILSMKEGVIPPIANTTSIDPKFPPLDFVLGEARRKKVDTVLVSGLAMGGWNTSVLVGRYG